MQSPDGARGIARGGTAPGCRDPQPRSREAYRIIALYEHDRNLLTPLAMYLKPDDITKKEVLTAIAALGGHV